MVWLSHGLLVFVPGEDLTGLESPLSQEDGDLLLRIWWWHLPPQQLERNFILRPPSGTNEDNAGQVLAKYRGEEVLAVPRVSWHNCQIRRINLKSNSISKNNTQDVKAFYVKGDDEKRTMFQNLWILNFFLKTTKQWNNLIQI